MKRKLLFAAAFFMAAVSPVLQLRAQDKVRPTENNTDVTSWLINPDFSDAEDASKGWEGLSSTDVVDGVARKGGLGWSVSQTVAGLPSGRYAVSVQLGITISDRHWLYLSSAVETKEYMFKWNWDGDVNTDEKGILAGWTTDKEDRRQRVGDVLVTDGSVTISIVDVKKNNGNPMYFDNFQLTYVDNGVDYAKGMYDNLKSDLQVKVNSGLYPVQLDAKANIELGKTISGTAAEDYYSAYTTMKKVADLYTTDALALKALQDQCQQFINEDATGTTGLATALEDSKADIDSNETTQGLFAALRTVRNTYVQNANKEFVVETLDFNDGRFDGWNRNGDAPSPEHGVMEFFNKNFDIWRSLTGLPMGWYQVEVQAYYRASNLADYNDKLAQNKNTVIFGDNGGPNNRYSVPALWIYEEDCSAYECTGEGNKYPAWRSEAKRCFDAGLYKTCVNVYVNENGNLNYGMAGTNQGDSWMCFDNFKLTYKGSDLSVMWDAMKAQAVKLAGKVSQNYADEFANFEKPGTVDETAVWSLNEKTKEIVNVADKVAEVGLPMLAFKVENVLEQSEDETAKNTLSTIMNKALSDRMNTVKTAEEAEVLLANARAAFQHYLETATPTSGRFDLTYFVQQTDFTGNNMAWQHDSGVGNFGFMNPNSGVLGYDGHFLESYLWNQNVCDNFVGKRFVYQTISNMPKGKYQFTAKAYNRRANIGDAELTDVYLYVNDGKTAFRNDQLIDVTANGLSLDGTVEFGIRAGETLTTNWCGIADVHLYYTANTLELSETEDHNVTSDTYANVTLTRTLKGGKWNTFCVPFDMEKGETFTEVKKLTGAVTSGETTTLTFEDAESIEAGVPYIVKVGESDVPELAVNGVTVKAAAPEKTAVKVTDGSGNTITMIGNYTTKKIKDREFFISNDAFYVADKEVTVNGYRAYLTMTAAGGENNVNRMLIDIDGEVTAIEEVLGDEVAGADKPTDVYTLSGVRVKSGVKAGEALEGLAKGIYIVNGKKVIK